MLKRLISGMRYILFGVPPTKLIHPDVGAMIKKFMDGWDKWHPIPSEIWGLMLNDMAQFQTGIVPFLSHNDWPIEYIEAMKMVAETDAALGISHKKSKKA